jgi:hypothetical protein
MNSLLDSFQTGLTLATLEKFQSVAAQAWYPLSIDVHHSITAYDVKMAAKVHESRQQAEVYYAHAYVSPKQPVHPVKHQAPSQNDSTLIGGNIKREVRGHFRCRRHFRIRIQKQAQTVRDFVKSFLDLPII